MMKYWITGSALLAACPVMAADLSLTVHGCLPGAPLRVALYDSPKGFSADRGGRVALREQVLRASSEVVRLEFVGLKPGRYAVAAFADKDSNGTLDENIVGKPTEPYGFSRDARNLFSAPSFEQAAFDVLEGDVTQTIHLK